MDKLCLVCNASRPITVCINASLSGMNRVSSISRETEKVWGYTRDLTMLHAGVVVKVKTKTLRSQDQDKSRPRRSQDQDQHF